VGETDGLTKEMEDGLLMSSGIEGVLVTVGFATPWDLGGDDDRREGDAFGGDGRFAPSR